MYPEDELGQYETSSSPLARKLRRMKKDHIGAFEIFEGVVDLLEDEEMGVKAYQDYSKNDVIKKLTNNPCGRGYSLCEIRTPKTDRRGVMRTYFYTTTVDGERAIVLLDVEFKDDDGVNTKKACERLKLYRRNYG